MNHRGVNVFSRAFPCLPVLVLLLLLPAWGWTASITPPALPVKLIFIHHSTGGNWLADANGDGPYGELGKALMNNNYYVSATNYGWGPYGMGDNTDIPHWPSWFRGEHSAEVLADLYSETAQNFGSFGSWTRLAGAPGGANQIIMFKSCFPNSDLYGGPADAAYASPNDLEYSVANAKAVYNDILTYFQSRQDKLFIVITAPPMLIEGYLENRSDPAPAVRAANARAFNNWLVNDWLDGYAYNNVAVFDYFNVLTDANNHHRWYNGAVQHVTDSGSDDFSAYPAWYGGPTSYDNHPSTTGHQKATAEFVPLLNYYYNRWQGSNALQKTMSPAATSLLLLKD